MILYRRTIRLRECLRLPARHLFTLPCPTGVCMRSEIQNANESSARRLRGAMKCVPLQVDRKLYMEIEFVRFCIVSRKFQRYRSACNKLSIPALKPRTCLGLMRAGLVSSLAVPSAGIRISFAP
jgi:hypothetical protein